MCSMFIAIFHFSTPKIRRFWIIHYHFCCNLCSIRRMLTATIKFSLWFFKLETIQVFYCLGAPLLLWFFSYYKCTVSAKWNYDRLVCLTCLNFERIPQKFIPRLKQLAYGDNRRCSKPSQTKRRGKEYKIKKKEGHHQLLTREVKRSWYKTQGQNSELSSTDFRRNRRTGFSGSDQVKKRVLLKEGREWLCLSDFYVW